MTDVVLHAPFAGWLGALGDVPDAVFAERMMGDGLAIDPVEGILRAPADAEVLTIPASAHAVTLRLANGAELLIHIGLETVALAGKGFQAMVVAGGRVTRGDPLIAFDLDVVARGAKDLVTPMVVTSAGATIAVEGIGRSIEAGAPIATVSVAGTAEARQTRSIDAEEMLLVTALHGLHARPAARIVALLKPFAAHVRFALGEKTGDAHSVTALLALGARQGDVITASASGADAAPALAVLARFASDRFGDVEAPAVPPPGRSGGAVRASPGVAIGRVRQLRLAAPPVIEQSNGEEAESAALASALADAIAKQGEGDIADAHGAMLNDPVLRDHALAKIRGGLSAGVAWRDAIARAVATLRATGDARLIERIADLADVERQVLLVLKGGDAPVVALEPGTILVTDDLLPSQFIGLDIDRLAGICTAAGGPTAHVAILAAAAGVPMIVAAGPEVLALADGSLAILDADAARLIVDPDEPTLTAAEKAIASHRITAEQAERDAQDPCFTKDGFRIEVFANLGSIKDAQAAVVAGAEGCGLLRTEFLFLDRENAPDEAEQRETYGRIAAKLGDRPLIIRTLDIGGDKPVAYLPHTSEENPALGQRGVRLSLARPEMLSTQLRAILAAVPGRQCKIMLPMVVDVAEILAARALLEAAMAATGRADSVELGVMIETPAAAILADQIAAHADFLSVGTNDLTQYALAADRGNAAVASMVDALHPAVLRLIAHAADGARRHGRWLGVCGSLASDPRAAALLVGLGVTELSAVIEAVPVVKAALRSVTMAAARELGTRALACASAAEVRVLIAERT